MHIHTFMYLIPRVHNVLLSALSYTDDGKEMLKIMGFSKFKSTKVMREGWEGWEFQFCHTIIVL